MLAIGSVGSLRPELGVGSFVCPDDFIALQLSLTTFDDARGHIPPGFDRRWRGEVLDGWEASGAGAIAGRRRLLAGDRAAVRDAGRDPADGGPRRIWSG